MEAVQTTHVPMQHRLSDAIAYVDKHGDTGIMNIVYAHRDTQGGAEVTGNGTCPHPLAVKLTPEQAAAPELLEVLKYALPILVAKRDATERKTYAYLRAANLVARARAAIAEATKTE